VKGLSVRKTLLVMMAVTPSIALASGYSLPNPHPRDLAVCASGVAAQSDAAAAFALPAALARMEGPSVRLGGGGVTVGAKWTDPTPGATQPPYSLTFPPATPALPAEPGTENISRQVTGFPTIAASWGGRSEALGNRGWGVGLALEPFGGTVLKWPSGWAGRYRITQVDREVFSGTLTGAIEVIPQIRIGGGLVTYYTKETFKLDLWQQGVLPPATLAAPDANAKVGQLDGWGFTYDVSFEVDPLKGLPLTIALDYKHKATQDLSGDVSWSNLLPALAAAPNQITSATHAKQTLTIPNTLNIGAAYRVAKPWLVMATFTFDRWVVYDADQFNGNNGSQFTVPRHYGNGQTYRAGVAWDALEALTVRAGLQRDVSGLDKNFYSPTLPDSSSWGGSLGGTFRFARAFSADAAVFYAKLDKVNVPPGGLEPGFPPLVGGNGAGLLPSGAFRGSYEPDAWVFSASVNWQPGAM
jgi:long-subunit fatty acid transport protein